MSSIMFHDMVLFILEPLVAALYVLNALWWIRYRLALKSVHLCLL
jgi:hypothetical protein